ncbi:UNVERIFIED_ORG: hypothetical protein FHR35_004676 [Microbispora rosea subsp. rosea]
MSGSVPACGQFGSFVGNPAQSPIHFVGTARNPGFESKH